MHESAHKMVLIFFVLIRPCLGASGFHGGDDCGVSTPIEVVEVIHDITDIKPCLIVLDAKSLNDVVQKNTYSWHLEARSRACFEREIDSELVYITEQFWGCRNMQKKNVSSDNCVQALDSKEPIVEICIYREILNKSSFSADAIGGSNTAQRGINGPIEPNNYWHNPTSTRDSPTEANWYQVNLGMTYFIPKVVLEDRNDGCCQDRMENVEVRIGFENYLLDRNALNPLCFFQDFPPPNITSVFKCTSGTLEGRFVLARKVGVTTSENNYAWTVREVRVWVTEWS